jgi:subtilisin family serine protease
MPSNRNLFGRITLTAGVLATGAVIGAMTSQAFAQGYGGYDNAPRYRLQSAPSRDPIAPPRRVVKPPLQTEAQAQPAPKAARTTRSIQKGDPQPQQPAQQQQSNARSGTGIPAAGERRFNQNEVVIEVAGRPTPAQVDAMARRHRLNREESQVFNLSGTTMFRWTIPDGRNVASVIRSLEADSAILSVQPNYRYTLQQARTGDGIQYSVEKLKLPRAHELAKGDAILVAVIDSGIDPNHPELVDSIADSFNPAGGDGAPHSHGTGIAGAIVAKSRLTGVAPRARILAVRAFDPNGASAEGTTFNILKGLEWASEKGARVINMSFAGPQDPIMARALAAANKKGIVLIAAVGNAGPKSPPLYPAADTNVIAVTATDSQDRLFQMSNRGNHVAVAAPGVDVILPTPGTSYQMATGTSFAAAHISGIVALVLEREPSLTPDSVRRVLLSTAHDLGATGRDKDFGAGIADAYDALVSIGAKPADALQATRSPQ